MASTLLICLHIAPASRSCPQSGAYFARRLLSGEILKAATAWQKLGQDVYTAKATATTRALEHETDQIQMVVGGPEGIAWRKVVPDTATFAELHVVAEDSIMKLDTATLQLALDSFMSARRKGDAPKKLACETVATDAYYKHDTLADNVLVIIVDIELFQTLGPGIERSDGTMPKVVVAIRKFRRGGFEG